MSLSSSEDGLQIKSLPISVPLLLSRLFQNSIYDLTKVNLQCYLVTKIPNVLSSWEHLVSVNPVCLKQFNN